MSGYLIVKIGVNQKAACQSLQQTADNGDVYEIPIRALLIIDALIDMEHAAGTAGGRWATQGRA